MKLVSPRDVGTPGDIVLEVLVGKDGRVLHAHGVAGDSRLVRAANRAVLKWAFHPYYLNGDPVEFKTEFTIQFDGKGPLAKIKIESDPLVSRNPQKIEPSRPPQ